MASSMACMMDPLTPDLVVAQGSKPPERMDRVVVMKAGGLSRNAKGQSQRACHTVPVQIFVFMYIDILAFKNGGNGPCSLYVLLHVLWNGKCLRPLC